MSACEICWERASEEVLLLGGSVVDRYGKLIESRWHDEPSDEPTQAKETAK